MRLLPLALLLPSLALAQEADEAPASEEAVEAPEEGVEAPEEGVEAAEEDDEATPGDEPTGDEPPPEAPPEDEVADDELEALRAQVAAMRRELDRQREELARTRLQLIPRDDLKFGIDGYYRTRGYIFNRLFASQILEDGSYRGDARYMVHRLRLQPSLAYRELASFHLQIDALDNALWGDNESLATTAVFAGDPSNTDLEGMPQPSIALSRAWLQATLPVGLIRVGRQPSQWGMGILANDGDGFDVPFGEKHHGTTYDRVLFATRPLAIVDAIRGVADREIPLITAIGVDRLVQDPLIRYHGYQCREGRIEGVHDDYDPRCDRTGDGVTDRDHSWTSDRNPEHRRQDWLADQDADVMEMVYVLVYNGQGVRYLGGTGDLTAGSYLVHRVQRETDSNILIADGYLNAKVHGFHLQFEGYTIQGTTRAIALPGATGGGDDPLLKQADIWGYVGRAGYGRERWSFTFEHGYASGDDNVADERFTGRPLNPDHNVGLLLYQEVISRVTAQVWGEGARALWSQGGVYNSRYIFPHFRVFPMDDWELITGLVVAWPDRPDGAVIRTEGAPILGWEVDVGLKHRWHRHLLFSLEAGYAQATDRLPLVNAGLNPEGRFFTVQSRIAYEF